MVRFVTNAEKLTGCDVGEKHFRDTKGEAFFNNHHCH